MNTEDYDIPDEATAVSSIRLAPQPDLDVERALLGALLLDGTEPLYQVMDAKLGPADFFKESHAEIFSAIKDLYERGEPIDSLTVKENLRGRGSLATCGGASYIAQLLDFPGVAAHAGQYAKILVEKATVRRLIGISAEITEKCRSNPPSVDALLDEAESAIYKVRDDRGGKKVAHMGDQLMGALDRINYLANIEGGLSGLPTGYKYLDKLTGGFQSSDLVVLGGRPGMGKTSMALNFALNVAVPSQRQVRKELPPAAVLVFSMEMSSEQLIQRILCQVGRFDILEMRSGRMSQESLTRLTETMSVLRYAPIFIDDTPGLKPLELRAKARRLQSKLRAHGQELGMVVVDYLQLMRPNEKHNTKEQEVSEVSSSLKSLAKELHLTVLALSQLKRPQPQDLGRKPDLPDLRDSGAIEQDADIVAFITREDLMKSAANKGQAQNETPDQAVLEIKKHRNGPTGVLHLVFKKESATFLPSTFLPYDPAE